MTISSKTIPLINKHLYDDLVFISAIGHGVNSLLNSFHLSTHKNLFSNLQCEIKQMLLMQIFIASVAHSTFWHRHHIYPIRSDASQTPRFDRLIKVICYLHVLQLIVFFRKRSKTGSSIRLVLSLRCL